MAGGHATGAHGGTPGTPGRGRRRTASLDPYVEEDQEAQGQAAPHQGEPRQAPEHGPRLTNTDRPLPPPTRRDDLVEVLHGIAVADPYRWLEDGDDAEVVAWVAAQNEHTREALDHLPDRAAWHERLVALLGARNVTAPALRGDRIFALERGGGAEQLTLTVRDLDARGPARVVVDPAAGGDATATIDWYAPSPDGRLVVWGRSTGGTERSELLVVDVDTGAVVDGPIPDTRAASVAWLPDASGFWYTRYPPGAEYGRRVHEHRLGDDAAADPIRWDALVTAETWADVSMSSDGRYVLVHAMVGWGRVDVHLHDRTDGTWRTVVEGVEARTRLRVHRGRLLGVSTLEAPRGRVVAVALDDLDPRSWTTLVAQSDAVVEDVEPVGDELLVHVTRHAESQLHRHDADGAPIGPVALPSHAVLGGIDGDDGAVAVAALTVASFVQPMTLYRWDAATGLRRWQDDDPLLDPDGYAVERETYRSADGTEVGLFTFRRTDVTPSPDTLTLLSGYGGFAIAYGPEWRALWAAWVQAGGVVAIAGLRGGTEEGEAWHDAGRRDRKPRVFEDFEAAADHLVATGRTARARLAIRGGSNGGLLVAAAETRRPDLCAAVSCDVPLTDMVRFPRFLIARLWVDEYGDPDRAEDLAWLHGYSPYHRVRDGVPYPATLVTCAAGDSRVDPCHARKFAAALQAATTGGPVLFRQEAAAGHGVGRPLSLQAADQADVLSFLADRLGWRIT
jgi:prolyl oligopeptidase